MTRRLGYGIAILGLAVLAGMLDISMYGTITPITVLMGAIGIAILVGVV